jgi:hypothetical protein
MSITEGFGLKANGKRLKGVSILFTFSLSPFAVEETHDPMRPLTRLA